MAKGDCSIPQRIECKLYRLVINQGLGLEDPELVRFIGQYAKKPYGDLVNQRVNFYVSERTNIIKSLLEGKLDLENLAAT